MNKLKSILIGSILSFAAVSVHAQVTVDKNPLTFSGQVNGAATQQTINVTKPAGSSDVFFLATIATTQPQWLKFTNGTTSMNGTTPLALTLTADPTGLVAGTYTGQLSITTPSNSATVNVTVNFTVSAIGVSPTSVPFAYQSGGSVPTGQVITLTGPNTTFTAAASTTSGGNWLLVAPTSGAITGGAGAVTASLDPNVIGTLAAGTYTGAITITPTGGTNTTPVSAAVTLTVTVPPPATISSTSLQLNYQFGGTNNSPQQVLTLSTTGNQALSYSLAATAVGNNPAGRNWVVINPSSGVIPANGSTQVTVSYDTTANLPTGTWTETLTLFTPGAAPAQQNIGVSLLVSTSPLLSVPSAGLNFTYELNSTVIPAAQSIVASSSNAAPGATTGQMVVTAAATTTTGGTWLSVTPANPVQGATGTATPFSIAVNPAGLNPGKYQGTVTFTGIGAGNAAQTVPVTLTVANDPSLLTNLSTLTFADQIGQAPVTASQTSQTVTLNTSTGATLNYVATATTTPTGQSWLSLSGNTTGSTNNAFTVTVNPASLTAGTYTGTVTITATNPATGNPAINSPITIPVTFYVGSSPLLVATLPGNPPSQPTFAAQVNGASPATQTVTLNSSNPAVPLTYNVAFSTSNGGNWLFATPLSGSASAGSAVSIGVLPGILSAGTYTGTVTITAQGPGGSAVADSPYTVPVTFQVTSGTLSLSQSTLTFNQITGGATPPTQTVQVSGNGQSLNYTAVANSNNTVNWLSVTPSSGNSSSSGLLTVAVDGSKLSPGTYTGTISVTSPNASNSPALITVTLTVTAGTIAATPASLTFSQAQGGAAPQSQNISVTGTPASLNFTASGTANNGGSWLTVAIVSPGASGAGATPGQVQVTANAGSLPVGQYTGTVTITSAGATGSPLSIPVTLNVVAPQTLNVTPTGTLAFSYIVGAPAPQSQQLQLTSSGATTFTATPKTTDGANWLSVTPTSGNAGSTATALTVAVSPTSLAAGNYTGTITIASPAATTPLVVNVTLSVSTIPQPVIIGIRNAASGVSGSISPGENITIFGTGIGPATLAGLQLTTAGNVSTNVGNTQVLFDGVTAAPIVYVSATQSSVMVPYEIAGRATTSITVVYQGVSSAPLTYTIVPTVPGIYTQNLSGTGPGAILNQDYSVNGPAKPAAVGSVVAVYMTGEGTTTPQAITGGVAPTNGTGLNSPILGVTATVGGVPANVTYKGSAPGFVYGAMQVDVQIPAGAASGVQPIVISIGGTPTQTGVTVQVQ